MSALLAANRGDEVEQLADGHSLPAMVMLHRPDVSGHLLVEGINHDVVPLGDLQLAELRVQDEQDPVIRVQEDLVAEKSLAGDRELAVQGKQGSGRSHKGSPTLI